MPDKDVRYQGEAQKGGGGTDWARLEAMTGEEALHIALADPDNPPLTDEQLSRMRRVPNPQEIRQALGLTQREFAKRFQIALGTLRDWEQGARRPDSAAKAYLRVIQENPGAVLKALDQSRSRSVRSAGTQWKPLRYPDFESVYAIALAASFVKSNTARPEVRIHGGVTATSELESNIEVEKRAA
jgi:putative transcriptional regulator